MKKYTLFLFVFTLFVTLLGFNVNSANATGPYNDYLPGCFTASQLYSITTGQSCGTTDVVECRAGDLFSSLTGKPCSGVSKDDPSDSVSIFNKLFKSSFRIGARGDDVKALQQFLKDEDYYFGKVDGKYGRITARAVRDFQEDNDITNIIIPTPIPFIAVISPNGGETWAKGSTQTIKWHTTGNISKVSILLVPTNDDSARTLATNVANTGSYSWSIPNCTVNAECSSNFSIPTGSYYIRVYDSVNNMVDESDAPFSIVAATDNNYSPIINGVSGPQTLNVNQTGTWTVKASSPNGGNLSYSVIWGDEDYRMGSNLKQSSPTQTQQTATFTHSYAQAGTYTPTFTVTSQNTIQCITTPCPSNKGTAQTSITVKVGNVTIVEPYVYYEINSIKSDGGDKTIKVNYGESVNVSWRSNGEYCEGHVYDKSVSWNGIKKPSGLEIVENLPLGRHVFVINCYSSKYGKSDAPYYVPYYAKDDRLAVEVVSTCSSGGFDPNTGFRCGCTSTSGYSSVDGKACDGSTSTANLTITTASPLPNAKVGNAYYVEVYATGGSSGSRYIWKLSESGGGSLLPPGLSLSQSCFVDSCAGELNPGIILGTPTTVGTYSFYVRVNSGSSSVQKQFTLTVDPATTQPSITVLSPNGEERWQVGSNHQIQFKIAENKSGYADLLIFPENNESAYVFNDFFENKKLSAGIYTSNWTIPQNVLTGKYIAKVYLKTLPVEGKVLSTDKSDALFRIVAAGIGEEF